MPKDNRDSSFACALLLSLPPLFLAAGYFLYFLSGIRSTRSRFPEASKARETVAFIHKDLACCVRITCHLIHTTWLVNFEHREIFAFSIHGCVVLSATMRLTERKREEKRKGRGREGTFMVERWKVTWKCLKIIIG